MKHPEPEERRVMSRYFVDWLIHDVMNGVDEDDLLKVSVDQKTGKPIPGAIFHKGRQLNKEEVTKLYQEAQTITESQLWKQLQSEMKFHAQNLMHKAKTEDDMYVAKTLLYTITVMNKVVMKFMV